MAQDTQTAVADAAKAANDASRAPAETAKAAASKTADAVTDAVTDAKPQPAKAASGTKTKTDAAPAKAAKPAAKAAKTVKSKTRSAARKTTARKPSPPRKYTGDSSMATATREAEKTVETVAAASNEAFKEGFEKSVAVLNDLSAFQRDSVDAVIASATSASKSLEELNARAVDYARKSVEDSLSAAKSLGTAKSVQEVVEIHADYTKSSLEAYLAELNKTTDLFAALVKDSWKPLNDRFAAAVEAAQSQR